MPESNSPSVSGTTIATRTLIGSSKADQIVLFLWHLLEPVHHARYLPRTNAGYVAAHEGPASAGSHVFAGVAAGAYMRTDGRHASNGLHTESCGGDMGER